MKIHTPHPQLGIGVDSRGWSRHLPYTVNFLPKGRNGSPKPQHRSREADIPEISPPLEHPPKLKKPGTAIPNLLSTLGHPIVEPSGTQTPPLTPGSAAEEELFFRLLGLQNQSMGSPSNPSFVPRREVKPKSKPTRPKATPFIPLDSNSGSDPASDGYFSIPVVKQAGRRRSSAISEPTEEVDWVIEKTDVGNGGLNNAVEASTDPRENIYVGTLGFGTDFLDETAKVEIEGRLREDHNCLVAYTSDADFDGHYNHYCKEVCLPLTGSL